MTVHYHTIQTCGTQHQSHDGTNQGWVLVVNIAVLRHCYQENAWGLLRVSRHNMEMCHIGSCRSKKPCTFDGPMHTSSWGHFHCWLSHLTTSSSGVTTAPITPTPAVLGGPFKRRGSIFAPLKKNVIGIWKIYPWSNFSGHTASWSPWSRERKESMWKMAGNREHFRYFKGGCPRVD